VGRVAAHIRERLQHGPMHWTLIDPEKSDAGAAAALAREAVELGSDVILLGGSTGIARDRMDSVIRSVKSVVPAPTIIFPEGPNSVSAEADAILFMSLLNSRDVGRVIRTQAAAAMAIRRLEVEPISLGYLVVAPGMRVGEVGEADPIPREELAQAQGYALAAEWMGMSLVYLEAGSGAPEPVPAAMVQAVREVLSVPLIVGGGIRSGAEARALLHAGANILVTGTVAEQEGTGRGFREILREVREARGG
jgi:phosphoglycerol geranylgeranyltransferase